MKKILSLVFITIIFVSGCAQKNLAPAHLYDMNIAPDIYRITFVAKKNISSAVLQDYIIYKSAQLTLNNNFKYFIILDSEAVIQRKHKVRPAMVFTSSAGTEQGTLSGTAYNAAYMGYNHSNSFTTIIPPKIREKDRLSGSVTIKVLMNNALNQNAFDATRIVNSFNYYK